MIGIQTGVLSILYYFIGPPILVFIIPMLMKHIINMMKVKKELQGKVVLITGASSGLGEALSHEFYKQGSKVILAARRVEHLERVKADLLALNCNCETFTPEILSIDVSLLEQLPELAQKALKIHGKIDILVNNAGVSSRGKVIDTSMEVHQRIMAVNYFGQICLTKALLKSMIAQKSGHIVMVNSVQGKIGLPGRSAYGASKHALQAYSDCLRAEIAQTGVDVTVANPGYINTSLSLNALTGEGSVYAKMDEGTAGGYTPIEVAKKIISSVKFCEKEMVMAPIAPKAAIFIRSLFPNLYFLIMERRAAKEF